MSKDLCASPMVVLDFGSQYAQLIARRVRECGVYCEVYPCDVNEAVLRAAAPSGIILSGGPDSTHVDQTARIPGVVFTLGCPVLGICYGMQAMAHQLGGMVSTAIHREFGLAQLRVVAESSLLAGLYSSDTPTDLATTEAENVVKAELDVWMSHGDQVTMLPPGFQVIASTDNAPIAAMADEVRHFYGVQFHPEVTHTPEGGALLKQFVLEICGCQALWNADQIIEERVEWIRDRVGKDQVILGLSGGVDSSVAAALLHKAIGDQLICIFLDTGLLRLNEGQQVMQTFREDQHIRVIHIDASKRFLQALAGVEDPEVKRKIMGRLFVEVFQETAAQWPEVRWLAQGTIYSDVIESAGASEKAHVIKSHHNVGGLPKTLSLSLLEPLNRLFKDEVRSLGIALDIPAERVYRHPFPGPGLAIRVLGAVTLESVELLRKADAIFIEVLHDFGWYEQVHQAFAVFLPVRSVGVMGDARKYEPVIALRAVETVDFMTARWARLPYALLERVSLRIVNEIPGISRVVYDVSGKPPATIEWE